MLLSDIEKVLLSEEEIKNKVKELGEKISHDYENKNLMLISILKGSIVFMSDLMRSITTKCQIDFLAVSSYGSSTKTSGEVRIIKDLDVSLEGFDVLVVEDILDSGMTLNYVLNLLKNRNPASINICTLLDKPSRRRVEVDAKYIGFEVPDEFVVGYGLDYAEEYRNIPFVGVLKPSVYQ